MGSCFSTTKSNCCTNTTDYVTDPATYYSGIQNTYAESIYGGSIYGESIHAESIDRIANTDSDSDSLNRISEWASKLPNITSQHPPFFEEVTTYDIETISNTTRSISNSTISNNNE